MFGRPLKLFKLFGFAVRVDLSWLIVAFLVAWTLASGLFPSYYKALPKSTYWWMGVAGAAGLFISIVFHEFWHSLVARKYGLPISGITLFVFGGVSEMTEEPQRPGVEFAMAIAGPISSFALGCIFYLLAVAGKLYWPLPVMAVMMYLAYVNGLLGIFNLLPAFPLDGGRVLRSILWRVRGDLRWATKVATRIGSGFGAGMIFLGAIALISGNIVSGIWWFLIGLFLRNSSQMSYRQLMVRRALEGERVDRFMKRDLVVVEPTVTLDQLYEEYVYKYHYKMFPVISGGYLTGVVTLDRLKGVPRVEWSRHMVREIVDTCGDSNTIGPEADATLALEKMNRTGLSRLMVVDRGRLVGILALRDLLKFLSIKMDLETPEV
jgi:Zn-dependent protease